MAWSGESGWSSLVPVGSGGTGITSYAVGDLLYASAAATLAKLADVAAGSYLLSGGVTTAPSWSTLTLPNAATIGDILHATATNAIGRLADVAAGSVLTSGGTGVIAAWSATPSVTQLVTASGTAAAPALKMSSEASGFFLAGVADYRFSLAGVDTLRFLSNTLAATADNAIDLGSTNSYYRTGYFKTSLLLGSATPTAITNIRVYSPTLTPAQTAASLGVAEQTFTVTGLTTADKLFVNGPVPTALCPPVTYRASAADTIAIGFADLTAGLCTPAAGVFNIVAVRS